MACGAVVSQAREKLAGRVTPMKHAGNAAAAAEAEARWRRLVEKGLRGRPFSDLVSSTAEGIAIEPLRVPDTPVAVLDRGATSWTRLQRIDHPSPDKAAALALEALNGGADGLALVFSGAPGARGFGVTAEDLSVLLRDIVIDACTIRIETGTDGGAIAKRFAAETEARRIDPALMQLSFGIDPFSIIAASGTGLDEWHGIRASIGALVARLVTERFRGPFLAADGRRAHEAGADAASELAFVASALVAYLRLLGDAGIADGMTGAAIETVLAADSDQFMTIAKFRAARLILRRILTASGLPAGPIRIHGETSWRMTTRLDPHSNLIRAAIAAFAAGAGGADSLAVLPYTAPFGLAAAAPRRLALDTQSILLEEVNLYRVADPSAGSGSIEALTRDLATEAWRRFQTIESEGGLAASLAAGALQARIGAERAARLAAIADGSVSIVGTNIFRASAAPSPDIEAPTPPSPRTDPTIAPLALPSIRVSEAAEGEAA